MARSPTRVGLITSIVGLLLVSIFVVMVWRLRGALRDEIHTKMIERNASVLYPVALQQLAESESHAPEGSDPRMHLLSLLKSVRQQGVLAMATFNCDGAALEWIPRNQLFVELPADDYVRLQTSGPISRYHPDFRLNEHLSGVAADQQTTAVLEVLLPLRLPQSARVIGFARYYIDARQLRAELAALDRRIAQTTAATLGIGSVLIAAVLVGAHTWLKRAQQIIAERNERLARANFELTLAAKVSALGQITSHLIHGLQGPIAGLRAVVHSRGDSSPDWQSAADYAERLQTLIAETVALLSDNQAHASYEVAAPELGSTINDRHSAAAAAKGVQLLVEAQGEAPMDSHRGSLLCLIASNLIQNAIAATPPGGKVRVILDCTDKVTTLSVGDTGPGICAEMRACLFQPGRSGRAGGTGLGLAISQLLARQLGGELALVHTGPGGTLFRLSGPGRIEPITL